MISGSFAVDNVVIVVSGVIGILLGIALLRWRSEFEAAASDIQRRMGPTGRKIASRPQRWATITCGIGFIGFGVLFVVLGLLVRF